MKYNTNMQLTSLSNVRKENITFHEPTTYTVKNSNLKYDKIKIETNYPNNKKGPLVIESPFLFSFGVNERRDKITNELVGYSIPVCLWSKEKEPTAEENEFYKCLRFLEDICFEQLEGTYGPEIADKLSPLLYFKKIEYTDKKGKKKVKRDETKSPVLYAKLMYSEKSDKILSLFTAKGNQKPDPLDYLNQYCKVKLALIIESIYISESVVSIQVKVNDAYVKPLKQRQSLLTIEESESEDEED